MVKFGKFIQDVAIYFYNNQLFVASESELPPIYASINIPPLYIASKENPENLTKAIDQARLNSKTKEQLTGTDLNSLEFTKEENKVMENASNFWTISWEENGDANLTEWELWPQDESFQGKAWRPKKFGSILLHKAVKINDIAQWLTQQVAC